jgi:DNA-binding transcriptional LysR family regulator
MANQQDRRFRKCRKKAADQSTVNGDVERAWPVFSALQISVRLAKGRTPRDGRKVGLKRRSTVPCAHFGVMEFLDNLPRKPRVIIQLPSRMPINPTTTFIRTISLAAVAEGFAVTVLPAPSIASEVSDRVIHRGLPSLPKLEVALYRANDQRAATQAFAEFLTERFARLSQ